MTRWRTEQMSNCSSLWGGSLYRQPPEADSMPSRVSGRCPGAIYSFSLYGSWFVRHLPQECPSFGKTPSLAHDFCENGQDPTQRSCWPPPFGFLPLRSWFFINEV